MPGTIESKIFTALMKRAQPLTVSLALPVAWPNVSFSPPADNKYLRIQHIPNVTERQEITSDGPHRYLGILQISVFWPQGAGETEPREIAGQIIAHFPADLILVEDDVEVRISKRPEATGLLQEESVSQIAVSVEFESYA